VRHQKGRRSTNLCARKRAAEVSRPLPVFAVPTAADVDIALRFWEGAELIETKRATSGKPEIALPATAGEGMVVQ
jgi:hypothetical protein